MSGSRSSSLAAPAYSGVALMAACSAGFLWGTGALVVNILIAQYGFAPGDISFWRFAVGAVFLCLVFGARIHLPTLRALLLPRLTLASGSSGPRTKSSTQAPSLRVCGVGWLVVGLCVVAGP